MHKYNFMLRNQHGVIIYPLLGTYGSKLLLGHRAVLSLKSFMNQCNPNLNLRSFSTKKSHFLIGLRFVA